MQIWVAPEQETFWGLSGPRPKRLIAPSVVDFWGNPGIWALSIGVQTQELLWVRRFPVEPFLETFKGPLVPISAY